MNLKKQDFNKLITPIIKRLEKAEKFTLEQAPDVCREIIVEQVQSNILSGIPLLILGLVIIAIALMIPIAIAESSDNKEIYSFCLFSIIGFFPIAFGYEKLANAYIINKTPKLTILKELSKLIKG